MEFNWYNELHHSSEIAQGDLIPDCPIVMPPSKIIKDEQVEIDITRVDSIILSQSCDLVNDKIQIVLVCPYFSLKVFIENLPDTNRKAVKKSIDNLKKGFLPGYHLLNKSEENHITDYLVVDFRNVYGIHIESLREIAKQLESRHRLQPPYREHLSQAFARYFMRVGLPQDIKIEGY